VRKIFVHVDGASRGNPGEAAIGVAILDEKGNLLEEVSQYIGRATNNVAEYKALIEGIKRAIHYAPEEAIFLTDSELVANQVNRLFRTREPHLQYLNDLALQLLSQLPKWRVNYVEREANSIAHRLAARAFRERTKEERERAKLQQEILEALRGLPLDDLRRILSYVQSLKARSE